MKRTRRKAAYQKQNQNKFSTFLVLFVVVMLMIVVSLKRVELQEKLDTKQREQQALEQSIEAEKRRSAQIEEFGKEIQTKGYIEEMAREKLGLVYENEILFKEKK